MSTNQRFTALDVFRGITVCFMIIVNTSGNGATTWWHLQHAQWHGFTPTDLVFPSFLFAVGNALGFVLPRWETKSNLYVTGKILKRTAIIFLLGYLMYWFPFFKLDKDLHMIASPISQTRIMGVLQRIALCYGAAALLLHFFKLRATLIISAFILVGYWLVLHLLGDAGQAYSMTGNIGHHIDVWLMGNDHLYHGEGAAFDPEGWLSTLPAMVNVVAGYAAGKYIQQKGINYEMLFKLALIGFAAIALAFLWNPLLPINKKLWTSSFVLLTTGLDCLILAGLIYCIDIRKQTRFNYFFEVFGRNPLVIYLLSELLATVLWMVHVNNKTPLYKWTYDNIFSHATPYLGSFLFAVCYMLLCWCVGWVMDKKKIYIRV